MAAPRGDQPFSGGVLLAGRFRLVREAGRGGMGVVWEAFDEKLARRVALKTTLRRGLGELPPEVRAAREVSHVNVCKVYDLHSVETAMGEVEFLSMEYVEGETLAERIRQGGSLARPEAREIALALCAGLGEAHRQGVVHGDFKSGNVILARTREGGVRAVVTDFGLANLAGPESDRARHGGTRAYMAPELFGGAEMTVASDIYALGVVFHEMLTGLVPPWTSGTLQIPQEATTVTAMEERPGPGSARRIAPLPAPWNQVVARCLAPSPDERFRLAEEVAEALRRRSPRRRWLLAGAAVVSAALGLALWPAGAPDETPVRLAVLPPVVEGGAVPAAAGVTADVADRLSGARRGFVVIPPAEAARYQVTNAPSARSALTATHVLTIALGPAEGRIRAAAQVIDTASGAAQANFRASYRPEDLPLVAKAVAAAVAGAFHFKRGLAESVAPPAYADYVQGIALLRRDRTSAEAALPFFERAAVADPRSALPYAGLAEARLERFERGFGSAWLAGAAESVAQAESRNPDAVPVLLAAGRLEQARGRYEQAARRLERAVELAPENAECWSRLAALYGAANRPEDARATFRKAIIAQPDYYAPYVEFGRFLFLQGRYREAEEQFRRVAAVAPRLAAGHMNLGLAMKEQGRYEDAASELEKALALQATTQVLTNLGALYYQEERYREAAQYFERISPEAPPNLMRYVDLGDVYRHLGRLGESVQCYRKARAMAEAALAENPRDARSRAILAFVAARLKDRSRAEAEIAQALALAPDNAAVLLDAALTFEALSRRERTLEVLAAAPERVLEDIARQPDAGDLKKDPRFGRLLESRAEPH